MYTVSVTRPSDWKDARIYILSDLHIGDPNADEHVISERIKQIADDPRGMVILNGDIMNTALRNSVSDVYGEKMTPMEQINYAVTLLSPIKDKIIGADTGNHEYRIYKNDGIDTMKMVCKELGVEKLYNPQGLLIFLQLGQRKRDKAKPSPQMYSIYTTHGTGGGRKEGAKAIRLADMASIVDADIYVHSHSHLPMIMKERFNRVDVQHKVCYEVEKLFVNDSAALKYGGYGQAQEFKPASVSSPVIHISGELRDIKATL